MTSITTFTKDSLPWERLGKLCLFLIYFCLSQITSIHCIFYTIMDHKQKSFFGSSNSSDFHKDEPLLNLIDETRNHISTLTQEQRFFKAKHHFEQALRYKHPRIQMYEPNSPTIFKIIYAVQSSQIWEWFLHFLSFIYMYIILFQNLQYSNQIMLVSPAILGIFWVDLLMEVYHRSYDHLKKHSKYGALMYARAMLLTILLVEEVLLILSVNVDGRPIRPFKVFRSMIPVLYIPQIRRSFQAILSAYKDIFVYFIFYATIIISFAVVASSIIQISQDQLNNPDYTPYLNDYSDFKSMVFIMYVTATYDAYPDNQLPAIRSSLYYYFFFVAFIFLNMFLFSSIPGSLIFDIYRQTRSKIILIDEIKMQHSLIISFVSLGEDNYEIDIKRIIKFFHWLYDFRVRYVDIITEICLKLNDDGNCSIHVTEFMQLGRILQQNSSLKPPLLKDVKCWIKFRSFINSFLYLKTIVNSSAFVFVISILTIASFITSIYCLYAQTDTVILMNRIFTYVFLAQIAIKLIGLGIQQFYNDVWNIVDALLIISGFITEIIGTTTNISALLKIFRIYRSIGMVKILLQNKYIRFQLSILKKLRHLFSTIVLILPLITRFFPLFMIVYYILGVIGMEIFYQTEATSVGTSTYYQFSNFQQFIYTQFMFVQVLTQAGWSAIAFDFANRTVGWFVPVMIFFLFCHITIVLVIATLLRSIFWSLFFSVGEQYDQRHIYQKSEELKELKSKQKIDEYIKLDQTITNTGLTICDTVMKRQIFQIAANKEILKILRSKNKNQKICQSTLKTVNGKIHTNFQINRQKLRESNDSQGDISSNFLFGILQKFKQKSELKPINQIQEIQEEDIQENIKLLTKKIQKKSMNSLGYNIRNPDLLLKHLQTKMIAPYASLKGNQSKEMCMEDLTSKQSLSYHIFSLHLLLAMRTCRRQQKALVIQNLVSQGMIDQYDGRAMLTKKITEKSFDVDENCTIRRMYLSDTNKNLIQKFEAEYFADIYGSVFKEINPVTIEPLIKLESTLTYALKNILRYPQISALQFFKILSKIQSQISNKLLKRGSLFKFVFQLNSKLQNVWFSIHYNHLNEASLHFIKHGMWLYTDKLQENQIYYANDIFKYQKQLIGGLEDKTATMKKLFQTFESLAFSLYDKSSFFQSNPLYNIYDTLINYIDVSKTQRFISKELQISKIMVVLLTKQDERKPQSAMNYSISDIYTQKPIDYINFKLDQSQKQTFSKLSKLSALNDDQITADEGLPLPCVLNFLCEVNDTLKLYSPNFIHQIQKVLNDEFIKIDEPTQQKCTNKINSVSQIQST